jgi:phosphatidylethanolamine/phosphatidyl-N-methylethanolamine N-methyltransferase
MTQRSARMKVDDELPIGDQTAFIRRFLGNPKRTGAVAPSGPYLAREMARAVGPRGDGQIVELGPGNGPVTNALIARGIARERLVLVECDACFSRMLSERFPLTRVVCGDAFNLRASVFGHVSGPVTAVVSSLPLLNELPHRRLRLLEEAFDLMGDDGVFVQFTYGVRSPVPRAALVDRYIARCGVPIFRNLPPARVWTYRRRASAIPQPKFRAFVRQAEQIAAQIALKKKKAEIIVRQQGDRVRHILAREAGETLDRFTRRGDES